MDELDLPDDLEDVEVIYSDGEYDEETADHEGMLEDNEDLPINDMSKYTFSKHTKSVFNCDVSSDFQFAVTGSEDDTAYVWNTDSGEVVFECSGHRDSVTEVKFNFDSQYVATGDMSGLIQVWSMKEAKLVWCNEGDEMEWLIWHPLTNVLLSGCQSGDIYIWHVLQGNCKVLPSQGSSCTCAKVLSDGKRMLTGYGDGQIKLWDIKLETVIWQLSEAAPSGITSLDINSEGTLVAVAPTSQLILLSDGRIVANLLDDGEKDIEVALISSELGVMVTGSLSGQLCVWDLGRHMLRHRACIECAVTIMKWGSDGSVFIGGTDGAVYICDVRTGMLLNTLTGHRADILSISVSSNGNNILTSSDDGTAKIFAF